MKAGSTLSSVWLPDLTPGTSSGQTPLGNEVRFHTELSYLAKISSLFMYILNYSSELPKDAPQPVVQPACCEVRGRTILERCPKSVSRDCVLRVPSGWTPHGFWETWGRVRGSKGEREMWSRRRTKVGETLAPTFALE